MKYLIDTCVLLDVFCKRDQFFDDSYKAFMKAATNKIEAYICSITVTNLYYTVRKYLGSASEAKKVIAQLLKLFGIIDVNGLDCVTANESEVSDYEDAIIIETCKRHSIDRIITRDKDYTKSAIPMILPRDL